VKFICFTEGILQNKRTSVYNLKRNKKSSLLLLLIGSVITAHLNIESNLLSRSLCVHLLSFYWIQRLWSKTG